MNSTFAKTRTKLMVLLIVVAIVALGAAMVFSAVNRAEAEATVIPIANGDSLFDAVDGLGSGDYILQLTADVRITRTLTINSSVTLDLNGRTLSFGGDGNNPVIEVTDGNFTLTDSNHSGNTRTVTYRGGSFEVTGGVITDGTDSGIYVSGGSFTFAKGTIAGNTTSDTSHGGGVTFASHASNFTMQDSAVITNNTAVNGGGVYVLSMGSSSLVMNGGSIFNNSATVNGGGVYLAGSKSDSLIMYDGDISYNRAQYGHGGGIYVSRDSTALINGGKVTHNNAVSSSGGGVYVDNGSLTMTGGEISHNDSTGDGGGVYLYNGNLSVLAADSTSTTVKGDSAVITGNKTNVGSGAGVYMASGSIIMNDGSIYENEINLQGNGAGIFMASGTLTMTGGSITGNRIIQNGKGAGVYVDNGDVNVQGNITIDNNTLSDNNGSNLYLVGSTTKVTVTGTISATARIGVTTDTTRVFTSGYGAKSGSATAVRGFYSDNNEWGTSIASGELTFTARAVVSVNGTPYGDFSEGWNKAIASMEADVTVQLLADVDYATIFKAAVTSGTARPAQVLAPISVEHFTLDLNGYMLRYTGSTANAGLITVLTKNGASTINFTLKDSRPQASAHEVYDPSTERYVQVYGGVLAGSDATATNNNVYGIYFDDIYSGSTINFDFQSGTVAGFGGNGLHFLGLNANKNNINAFTMRSGAAVRYNGQNGVYLIGSQPFIMYGGDVSYNGSRGVRLESANASMVMYNGKVTYNVTTGIHVTYGSVEIFNGDVSYNGTEGFGADGNGVVGSIHGGTFTHNTRHGIFLNNADASSSLTIDGGDISYNGQNAVYTLAKATIKGANTKLSFNGYSGIRSTAELTVEDCTINNNGTARVGSEREGITTNKSLSLKNVTISGHDGSGIIYSGSGSVLTMEGGSISGSAYYGISLSTGTTLNMISGEIFGNGTGVYVSGATFNMEGGKISNNGYLNITSNYGGVVMAAGSSFTMTGGEICGNTAPNGAGVRVFSTNSASKTYFKLDGGSIHDNIATNKGGGVYVNANRSSGTAKSDVIFEMVSGEITGNKAAFGGGVAVEATSTKVDTSSKAYDYTDLYATFIMTGGKVENNTASMAGGVYDGRNGQVKFEGTPVIQNNHDDSGIDSNLFITGENVITITKSLSRSAVVYLSFESTFNGKVITENFSEYITDNESFFLDDDSLMMLVVETTTGAIKELKLKLVDSSSGGVIKLTKADGTVEYYGTLKEAFAAVTGNVTKSGTDANTKFTGDTIQLLADVGVDTYINVAKSVILDLNGFMIKHSGTQYYKMFDITGTAAITFVITDSTMVDSNNNSLEPTSTHYVTSPITNGLVAIKGGVITSRVVVYNPNAILEFKAGSIAGSAAVGGDYPQSSANHGIALELCQGTINMYKDVNLCYNYRAFMQWEGTATMYGGKVYSNSDKPANTLSTNGYPGLVIDGGTFTMKDGEIFGNTSDRSGTSNWSSVILASSQKYSGTQYYATVNIEGGSIHDNEGIAYTQNGSSAAWFGAIIVSTDCTLKITGGSITNNRTTNKGTTAATGGVFVMAGANFQLAGNPVITGNTVGGVESNIYLPGTENITIAGKLLDGAKIGVTLATNNRNFTTGYNGSGNNSSNNPFYSDSINNCVTYNSGEMKLSAHTSATLTEVAMELATCTTNGHPKYWECKDCHKKFTDITPGAFVEFNEETDNYKGEHVVTTWVKYNEYTHSGYCTVCGQQVKDANHSVGSWTHVDGTQKHTSYCSVCKSEVERSCTYEGNYKYSDAQHWQECTACGAEYEKKEHTVTSWTSSGILEHKGTCTVCKKSDITESHKWGAWSSDDAEHWQTCSDCNAASTHVAHVVNNWTETTLGSGSYTGTCEDCNRSITKGHKWKLTEWKSANGYHWHECEEEDCNDKYMYEKHDMNWGTGARYEDKHNGTCNTCGESIIGDCTYSSGYGSDDVNHWIKCDTCGQAKVVGGETTAHEFKLTRVRDVDGYHAEICATCGYEKSNSRVAHTFNVPAYSVTDHWMECACGTQGAKTSHTLGWQNGDGRHWEECSGCEYSTKETAQEHRMQVERTPEGHSSKCDVCGLVQDFEAHNFKDAAWKTDNDQHWQLCTVCDYESARVDHKWGNATPNYDGTHSAKCEICELQTDAAACVFGDPIKGDATHSETCKVCSYTVETPHSYNKRQYDSNEHWMECVCGAEEAGTRGVHDFGDNLDNCTVCGAPSNDLLAAAKRKAKEELNSRVDLDTATLTGPNKDSLAADVAAALERALKAIDTATSQEAIDEAVAEYQKVVAEKVLKDRKDIAEVAINEKADEVKNNLPADLTEEEREQYEQAIEEALTGALNGILGAEDVDQVTSNLEQGKKDIDSAVLATSRTLSKEKLQQHAKAKQDAFQEMVDNGEISQEEADRLKDLIDKEADRAEGKIDKAATVEEVREEQQRGEKVIDDIVANPDLAEDKSQGRDDLEDEAQKKKDEIDEKVKNGELTPEEGEDLKKKVDEETKKAEDKVTDSKTSDEVKDAVEQGKADIGSAAQPTPAKKGFFDFINGNFPVHIAAITLGAMLLVMIILAIAARKRKQK